MEILTYPTEERNFRSLSLFVPGRGLYAYPTPSISSDPIAATRYSATPPL